ALRQIRAGDGGSSGRATGVISAVEVGGGPAAAGLFPQAPAAAEIDKCGETPAMGVAPVRIAPPLFPPRRLQFDAVVIERNDFQTEPLMIRGAGDERLHALERDVFAHGTTT